MAAHVLKPYELVLMTNGTAATEGAYAFGEFRIEPARRLLLYRDEPAPLTAKAFDTLLELVRHRGEVVVKDDLMRAVWPDTFVEENNLNQHIGALRRVLQDRYGENRYIVTVPGRGYQFVAEVDLVAPTPAAGAARLTVAVLPFAPLDYDPQSEYLADGLTEDTIAALGQVDPENVGVIGRTTVMEYKRSGDGAASIGRELGAAYVVEGSLRSEAGHRRVTATLVRTRDQSSVWTASFDSEPTGVLEFQRELANVIAQQVRLRLDPRRLAALGHRQTRNVEAFDSYLRGRHLWHQLTPPSTRQALQHFAQATRLDADYALAWSGIADAHSAMPITGDASPRAVASRATEASEHALRVRPDLAEAQASVGFRKFWLDWDWAGAEAAFRRAIELDPSYSFSFRMIGLLHSHRGRPREALPAMRRARELDPLLPVHHALSAQVAFAGSDYALAAQFARQALAIDPGFWIGHFQLAQAAVQLGDFDLAQRAIADAGTTSGGNSKVVALRGYLHARQGRKAEARQVLETLVALAGERYVPPCAIALVHAGLGDIDAAAHAIERAYEARDVHLMFIPVDEKWSDARSDARIAAILQRCGFARADTQNMGC
jgi:DNA-binding winged helix-turn-helix (wHTH) protein/tetratricopeptide (TPR) repeat protein